MRESGIESLGVKFNQGVAQLVERYVWDVDVGGSSPLTLTILRLWRNR